MEQASYSVKQQNYKLQREMTDRLQQAQLASSTAPYLVGYFDNAVMTPWSIWDIPHWLWNGGNLLKEGGNAKSFVEEIIRRGPILKDLKEKCGEDEIKLKMHFIRLFKEIRRSCFCDNIVPTGLISKHCEEAMYEEAQQTRKGSQARNWELQAPITHADVKFAQVRFIPIPSSGGMTCWFQIMVRFRTKERLTTVDGDKAVPSEVVWWLSKRHTVRRNQAGGMVSAEDRHTLYGGWQVAGRVHDILLNGEISQGKEVRAQIPKEEVRKQSELLWQSSKEQMKNRPDFSGMLAKFVL